jgi:hypothetical protein
MLNTPVKVSRPSRTPDGVGGSVVTAGTQSTLWVGLKVHQDEVNMTFRAEEDVRVGDLVQAPSEGS